MQCSKLCRRRTEAVVRKRAECCGAKSVPQSLRAVLILFSLFFSSSKFRVELGASEAEGPSWVEDVPEACIIDPEQILTDSLKTSSPTNVRLTINLYPITWKLPFSAKTTHAINIMYTLSWSHSTFLLRTTYARVSHSMSVSTRHH